MAPTLPLSELTQVIYLSLTRHGESARYLLHARADAAGRYWKVRLYGGAEGEESGDGGEESEGAGGHGVVLYKGYAKIKDITSLFSARSAHLASSSHGTQPALRYLERAVRMGEMHITIPSPNGGGGTEVAKKRKAEDGRAVVALDPPEEIKLHVDHEDRTPLIIDMRISSPPSASSDQHDDGIESKNNLAAQCGLMDLCASMAARLSEVQAREAEREEREAEQERERAEGRGGGGASKAPVTPERRGGSAADFGSDVADLKKKNKDLELQIRLLLRRLPASPSQAGPAPLRAHVPVPVPDAGASRLQPTRKAAKKVETGFLSGSESD